MYSFKCGQCGCELHLAPVYKDQKTADRALELLGWTRTCCADCSTGFNVFERKLLYKRKGSKDV